MRAIRVRSFRRGVILSSAIHRPCFSSLVPKLKPSDVLYKYKSAAVTSDISVCSAAGKNLLLSGGNAVDAAIGTLLVLCLSVTSPSALGLAGGFFMTIYNASQQQCTVIDARETAPENATTDMFKGNPELCARGPLSIAVPGEVKGYWLAHQKYGKLPWSVLFKPAIKMANEGFLISASLHKIITDEKEVLLTEPSLREIFINPKTNKLYQYNEMMFRPELGKTMEILSEHGVKAWEEDGALLDSIMEDLNDVGAIITKKDIKEYQALQKKPLEIILDNTYKLFSPPLPSSGPVLSFIMNILEGYNLTSEDIATIENKILTYHRAVETFKFGYAKRTALGDDAFVSMDELVEKLVSKKYAAEIRRRITDDKTHDPEYYEPTNYMPHKTGTSHVSVLDEEGNAVSVTSTLSGRFGACRRGRRTGILWNNSMDNFSSPSITNTVGFLPSEANFIQPGKRPLSSLCPAILVNIRGARERTETGKRGNVRLVIGASGGSRTTAAVSWVLAHNLWLGQNIKESVDNRRLHHQLYPNDLMYEEGFDQVLEGLRHKGHNLVALDPLAIHSVVQSVEVLDGEILAASDYRKCGIPDGF